MSITFPQTPDPLIVNISHIEDIKEIWSEIDITTLENDVCSYILRMQNIPEMSSWHRLIIFEEYQIKEIIHFLDFTIQLLQDLHRPKMNALHTQMMVQISKVNTRMFQIDVAKYSNFGESLTMSFLEQLGRDTYTTEMELMWTRFYSDVAQLMIHHAKDPKFDLIRITQPRKASTASGIPTTNDSETFTQQFLRSTSEVSTTTTPSRLSLMDDGSSDLSFQSETEKDFKSKSPNDLSSTTINQYEASKQNASIIDNINHLSIDDATSILDSEVGTVEVTTPLQNDDVDDDDDDDAFDYLNSFADQVSHSKNNKSKKEEKKAQRATLRKTQSLQFQRVNSSVNDIKVASKGLQPVISSVTSKRRLSMAAIRPRVELTRTPSMSSTLTAKRDGNELTPTLTRRSKGDCVIM